MAEEDLLFGKNRHLFGGIEPSNMRAFSAISRYQLATQTARIKITGKLPADTIINDQTLCTVTGAVIRKSTTDYPETEFDGEQIADVKVTYGLVDPYSFEIIDSDVTLSATYYYAAFPYTAQGVYNRNMANRAKVTAMTYDYLFGYDLDLNDTNPDTRVSYPEDTDNVSYNQAKMNFTSGVFDYGDWPDTAGEKFMPKPCMLTFDCKVYEYLNQNKYAETVDGETSQIANTSFEGNAMMEWDKPFTKRWVSDDIYHFRCSDQPIDEDYDCWSNYDKNNKEIDHFYTPIYFGSNVSSKLRSISGQANMVSQTRATEITYAQANGDGWYTEFLCDRLLIQDLLVLMFKTTNLQTALGTGRCASGNSSAIGQGTMNDKGLFWGDSGQSNGVKVFGMENWYGNLWRAIAGWINANGTQKVKLTWGTHDGSWVSEYNTTGEGYITLSDATPAGTSGGYISAMKNDLPYGRIPYQASGSATTNEADGLWFNNSQVDYALVGGYWSAAFLDGPFCANLDNTASNTNTYRGAALSCKPLAA